MNQYKYTQEKGFEKVEGNIYTDGSIGVAWDKEDKYNTDEDFFRAAGYFLCIRDGYNNDEPYCLDVYVSEKEPNKAVAICPEMAEESYCVILTETSEDLLALRVALAPLLTTIMLGTFCSTVEEIATKAFRAWHGHDWFESCMECDPIQTENMLVTRARVKARAGKQKEDDDQE